MYVNNILCVFYVQTSKKVERTYFIILSLINIIYLYTYFTFMSWFELILY